MPRERRSKYANDAVDNAQLATSLAQNTKKIEHFGYNLNDGLLAYRIALSNVQNQMVRVFGIGDSVMRGEYSSVESTKSWVGKLRISLQNNYGNAPGEGFIGTYEGSLPAGAGSRWTLGAGWQAAFGGGLQGLYAKSQGSLNPASVTFTGTSVTLLYSRESDGGVGNITIDGSAPATNPTINCFYGQRDHTLSVTYTGLTNGTHTLSVTPATTANVGIEGIIANNDATSGIQVNRLGISGRTSAQWNNALFSQRWNTMKPDLAIIALGLNDSNTSVPLATYKANLATLIQTFQSYGSSVLLVPYFQPDTGWIKLAPWSDYVQVNYDLADQYNTGLVDIYRAWGTSYSFAQGKGLFGLTTNNFSGASGTNTGHPGDKGYGYIAQVVQQCLTL
jgi:lysophospholipase L1-like esterase